MTKLEPHPLMRTIVDHPDLDAPRLVYADWLDEQGDPKLDMLAEYIRLSIELHRMQGEELPRSRREAAGRQIQRVEPNQREKVSKRIRELERQHRDALLPPIPKWARWNLTSERGLPWQLNCTFKQFATGGRVLEFAPITSVVLRPLTVESRRTFARQELVRVRQLRLFGPLHDGTLSELTNCANLTNLRELLLGGLAPSDAAAEAFAQAAPRFPSLIKIHVSGNLITPSVRVILLRGFGDRLWINGLRA